MKSGKTQELISSVSPYKFSKLSFGFYQPASNKRDLDMTSRTGLSVKAQKVKRLYDIKSPQEVIAVDEMHMFNAKDAELISQWLDEDKTIYASGLDLDYRAKLFPIIARLFELKPDTVTFKRAVCDKCQNYQAQFTQILKNGRPITSGLPYITIDDGDYEFQACCRKCFVKNKTN